MDCRPRTAFMKDEFYYGHCTRLEEMCLFCCIDCVTHSTLWDSVQAVPVTVGYWCATAQSMAQHIEHSQTSCNSTIFFGLLLHLAHATVILFSFGWPVQGMFYFTSAHFCFWTAGLTHWHTTHLSILFMG
jgi:hypothetical protein